jgi:hypothetical protein
MNHVFKSIIAGRILQKLRFNGLWYSTEMMQLVLIFWHNISPLHALLVVLFNH